MFIYMKVGLKITTTMYVPLHLYIWEGLGILITLKYRRKSLIETNNYWYIYKYKIKLLTLTKNLILIL